MAVAAADDLHSLFLGIGPCQRHPGIGPGVQIESLNAVQILGVCQFHSIPEGVSLEDQIVIPLIISVESCQISLQIVKQRQNIGFRKAINQIIVEILRKADLHTEDRRHSLGLGAGFQFVKRLQVTARALFRCKLLGHLRIIVVGQHNGIHTQILIKLYHFRPIDPAAATDRQRVAVKLRFIGISRKKCLFHSAFAPFLF